MFTIVISERGGTERRETFDRSEINLGRVQGNDLMLAKGNVSKHHARLLCRDGRFIVTDLKSTNGTYVNGRKISQATIVREGDKIYVGDFVLRLEPSRPVPAGRPSSLPPVVESPSPSAPSPAVVGGTDPPHLPLERDPDSVAAASSDDGPVVKLPSPPRMPRHDVVGRTVQIPSAGESAVVAAGSQGGGAAGARAQAPSQPGGSIPARDSQQSARRLALITLADRVADAIDLSALRGGGEIDDELSGRVEKVAREQAEAMKSEGESPGDIDLQALVRDALRELLGLGAVGTLLEDDDVREIQVVRPDHIVVTRTSQPPAALAPAFTSEEALARVVARLAFRSGQPIRHDELVVERRLSRDVRMVAVGPPAAGGWTVAIRRRTRVESSVDELVRSGVLSRSMGAFLGACVAARANVLVVGTAPSALSVVLAALASAVPPGDWVAVLQDLDEIAAPQAHVATFSLDPEHLSEGLRGAIELRPDRLVVASLAGDTAVAVVDAISDGREGVVAATSAPTLRHGLARLAARLAQAHGGGVGAIEAARDALAEAFDVAVEVVRGADGRTRLHRVAEVAGTDAKGVVVRDIFHHVGDGSADSFVATGTAPRVLMEFAARGVKVDPAIFKRTK